MNTPAEPLNIPAQREARSWAAPIPMVNILAPDGTGCVVAPSAMPCPKCGNAHGLLRAYETGQVVHVIHDADSLDMMGACVCDISSGEYIRHRCNSCGFCWATATLAGPAQPSP